MAHRRTASGRPDVDHRYIKVGTGAVKEDWQFGCRPANVGRKGPCRARQQGPQWGNLAS